QVVILDPAQAKKPTAAKTHQKNQENPHPRRKQWLKNTHPAPQPHTKPTPFHPQEKKKKI
ncbi:hypothetical protein AB6V49_09180, partial [Stenotrophomonas maltophilia]